MASKTSKHGTEIDLATLPTSDHLTLLFTHGKSTTLLSVLPTQPFSEIKEMLLAALRSRNISTLPGSVRPLPSDASQIQLGIQRDRKDPSKGWTPLIVKETQPTNGKAGKRKATDKSDIPNEGPAAAGLVDGSRLAYRIAPQMEDEDDVMLDADDAEWDVVLPSYDDEEIEP